MNPFELLALCGAPRRRGLCFTALEAGSTISMIRDGNPPAINGAYTVNDGKTWAPFIVGETVITLGKAFSRAYIQFNQYVLSGSGNYNKFVLTGKIACFGSLFDLTPNSVRVAAGRYQFSSLFAGCAALVRAPEIANTAANGFTDVFNSTFSNCTGLTETPPLPSGGGMDMYSNTFNGCTGLTKIRLPGTGGTAYGERALTGMFARCTGLEEITVEWTTWPSASVLPTLNWLNAVAATGTFKCPQALTIPDRSSGYVPAGWTIERY